MNNDKILLKPSKRFFRNGLLGSIVFFLFSFLLLIMLFKGLGIVSGRRTWFFTNVLNLFVLIIFILLGILLLIEIFIRTEASISKDRIITPFGGVNVRLGILKQKIIKSTDIESIYLLQDHVEIESKNYDEKIRISVNPIEFKEIIETKFPMYKSKMIS